jgi:hypothetical protein
MHLRAPRLGGLATVKHAVGVMDRKRAHVKSVTFCQGRRGSLR